MSKEYLRASDGFRVNDAKDRPITWAVETYGGELSNWSEVLPPVPPTEDELKVQAIDAELAEIERIENIQSRKSELLSQKVAVQAKIDLAKPVEIPEEPSETLEEPTQEAP